MRVRVLDGDRSCLDGMPFPDPAQVLPPELVRTVVVEEGGKVVATMSVMQVPYIEAVWLDPEHRNAGVVRALVRSTWNAAMETGAKWGFSAAADDAVASILSRLGGKPLPVSLYVMPFEGRAVCQPR